MTPHLLSKTTGAVKYSLANNPDGKIPFRGTEQDWLNMQTAMELTVKSGTAKGVYTDRYRLAGKTGTAQVKSIAQGKRYNEAALSERHRDHGWFIAFAPVDNPQIAVAVIVENGRGGSKVAPIARKAIDYWLLTRHNNPITPPSPEQLAKINAEKQQLRLQRQEAILSGKPIVSKPSLSKSTAAELTAVGDAD